jgi:glycosyltransferase involved in cell wall biosynthesis
MNNSQAKIPTMENQIPLVSIGLPVYNGENFVAEAIKCVLSQTFSDWELIISDNTSTDRTVSICHEFADKDSRIRVFQNKRNLGAFPNFNRVFQLSRGRYFKWIAHDDLFGAEFIESCLQELEKDDRAVLVFPKLVYVDADGRPLRCQETPDLSIIGSTAESRVDRLMRLEAQSEDIFWSQYGLIRSNILEKTRLMGLYNGSDQVLLLEIALRGNFKQVEKELFFRREHPAASTLRRGWGTKERATFFYADDGRTLVFPYCRMLKEHLTCIWNSSNPFFGKMQCAAAVLKRFLGHWKYFAHEIIESPLEVLRAK